MFLLAFYGVWRVEAWSSKWHCLSCMVVEQVLLHAIYLPWMADHCSAVCCAHALKASVIKSNQSEIRFLCNKDVLWTCHFLSCNKSVYDYVQLHICSNYNHLLTWGSFCCSSRPPAPFPCKMPHELAILQTIKPLNQDTRMPVQVFQLEEPCWSWMHITMVTESSDELLTWHGIGRSQIKHNTWNMSLK
jgi:hypothetical protein